MKILTPQIISILFGIKDPEEIQKSGDLITSTIIEAQTNLAKRYLLEKGITQDEIDKYFGELPSSNSRITEILSSEEIAKQYTDIYNAIVESIYEQQLQKLDDTSKGDLDAALKLTDASVQADLSGIDVYMKIQENIEEMKKSGQVTQEQIDASFSRAYDKKFGQSSGSEISPSTQAVSNSEDPNSNQSSLGGNGNELNQSTSEVPDDMISEAPTQAAPEEIEEVPEMKTEENPSVETSLPDNAPIQVAQEESEAPDQPNI